MLKSWLSSLSWPKSRNDMADNLGNIGYQLGEIASGLKNVQAVQQDRNVAAERFAQHVEDQIKQIKAEQERAREAMYTTSRDITGMREDLQELKRPVEELTTLRNKMGGLVLAFGFIFTVLGLGFSAVFHVFGSPISWFSGGGK